ncbi:hypothetical protein HNP02_006468 [Mycobacterium sp. AZCC_0083]|nr:hypothetical protein [Mycobacterium sp. AZCC_0083]
MPVIVLAGGCSSSGPSTSPSGPQPTSHQDAPGTSVTAQTSTPKASASATPSPVKVTSGILAVSSIGNKRIYSFIDPNSGQYSEAVTFTIPTTGSVQSSSFQALAASPDLTKLAVAETVDGESAAGWIDSSGQFTSVTTAAAEGPFGGSPPSYSAIGFDGAGNYYYSQNSQGAMYTEAYEVLAGSTGNAQKLTLTPPGAAAHGAALNSDGSVLFGCQNMAGNWLDANTLVMTIAPGTQIAKIALAGREKGGCPITPASNQVTLLPTTNTATVHDPVANSDGTKVAFFYDDPDRVKHNFPAVYTVGTDGNSQPTVVNLSESDAKKLVGATFLRWS